MFFFFFLGGGGRSPLTAWPCPMEKTFIKFYTVTAHDAKKSKAHSLEIFNGDWPR